jgi:hypothetical protein
MRMPVMEIRRVCVTVFDRFMVVGMGMFLTGPDGQFGMSMPVVIIAVVVAVVMHERLVDVGVNVIFAE